MRTIIVSAVVFATAIISLTSAQTPAGVTDYRMISFDATRDQAIATNVEYTGLVVRRMTTLANQPAEQAMAGEFADFYANPSSDDRHFQQALEMVNLAYASQSDLSEYIDKMYKGADLASGSGAAAYAATRIARIDRADSMFVNVVDSTERGIREDFYRKGIPCGDEFQKLVATAKRAEAAAAAQQVANGY